MNRGRHLLIALLLAGSPAVLVGCSSAEPPHGSAKEGTYGHDHEGGSGHNGQDEQAHEAHQEGVVELSPETAARIDVRVAPVTRQNVPFQLRTTARVDYDQRRVAHVSPRIPGRVVSVLADLGDDEKAGTWLATLDSIELGQAKADYLSARAEESVARKTLAREERLFKEKIVSEQAVLEARGAHEKALARLRSAEERLRLLGLSKDEIENVRYGDPESGVFPLTAPLAGRIVEKHLVVGELVGPEDKVFTVADLSRLWIWIDVYERDLAHVRTGDAARIFTQAYPDKTFEGRVSYVTDWVEPDTRAARARIDISNRNGLLKPGMFAEVVLTDTRGKATEGRKALAVPAGAVLRDGDHHIAFVKVGEGRYERRVLRIGTRTEDAVEILDGLAPGEQVVVSGGFILKSEAAKEEMGGGHSH